MALCDEVELLEANPNFAHVRINDGRETTVALKNLAPCPTTTTATANTDPKIAPASSPIPSSEIAPASSDPTTSNTSSSLPQRFPASLNDSSLINNNETFPLRRSTRQRRPPDRYGEGIPYQSYNALNLGAVFSSFFWWGKM